MAQDEKTIYVYENWRGEAPTLLGRLRCGFVRGQETFSFEYDPAWLSSAESSFSLDPDLALYRGRQYVPLNKQLFRLLSGSLGASADEAQGGHRRSQRGPQAP